MTYCADAYAPPHETPAVFITRYSAATEHWTPGQEIFLASKARFDDRVALALREHRDSGHVVAAGILERYERLIRLISDRLPVTDAYVSSNGSLCFDWDEDPSWQLSLLLQESGRLAFAAYFRGERVNGSAPFGPYSSLPQSIETAISRWTERPSTNRI